MQLLVILNDAPYGTERSYNGLRLALNVLKNNKEVDVTAFLMGDAVAAAKAGQQTPAGYYSIERMLRGILTHQGHVLLCGTCMDARGIREEEILDGGRRSTLDELTDLTTSADKVLIF